MTLRSRVVIALLVAGTEPSAAPGDPETAPSHFSLARVAAPPGVKVRFQQSLSYECEPGVNCSGTHLFLLAGDVLITNGVVDDQEHVWFFGRGRSMRGMLPKELVKKIPFNTHPTSGDWRGIWVGGGNRIVIKSKTGSALLEIHGEAQWHGGHGDNGPEVIHYGEAAGSVAPNGNRIVIRAGADPSDCVLELELVADFLGATDNMHCGGMNVSFSNVYTRDTQTKGGAR